MRALKWDRAGASPYVRLCLFHKDLDPGWYQLWRVVAMFRTQVRTNPVLADWWKMFGTALSSANIHGPFGKIIFLLEGIGLFIDSDLNMHFSERGVVSVVHAAESTLSDVLARNYQRWVSTIIAQRTGFAGLDGFDEELTTSNDQSFTAAEVEQLMIVRDGSFFTNSTKNKWDSSVAETCAWCQVKDTKQHRYTECARYDDIRAKYQSLFACWDELPDCFRSGGLVPANPYQEAVWEALNLMPSRVTDYQFGPSGTTSHAFTDGTCKDPTTRAERLAAWSVVIADRGPVAFGPLTGMNQCIYRAELTAVISALSWIRGHIGVLHIWCDNQTVVDLFRKLQAGLVDVSGFEHSDLWNQVHDLLSEATAEILIHKVYSHDVETECNSPLEDFCRQWNNLADLQAEVANQTRPSFFSRVWDRFCEYRSIWKQRVKWYTQFVVEVAGQDCSPTEGEDQDCIDFPDRPIFATTDNTMQVAATLLALDGRVDLFEEVCSFHFQAVFHQLIDWFIEVDSNSATKRPVSYIEMYVGFRLSRDGKRPVVVGSGLEDKYSPISFAVDFSYFKQVLGKVIEISGLEGAIDQISLKEINILSLQPLFNWVGTTNWRHWSFVSFPGLFGIVPLFRHRVSPGRGNHLSFGVSEIRLDPMARCGWLSQQKEPVCKKSLAIK